MCVWERGRERERELVCARKTCKIAKLSFYVNDNQPKLAILGGYRWRKKIIYCSIQVFTNTHTHTIYIYTCTCVCIYTQTHNHTCVQPCAQNQMYCPLSLYILIHICISIYYTHAHTCICICICICLYICIYNWAANTNKKKNALKASFTGSKSFNSLLISSFLSVLTAE